MQSNEVHPIGRIDKIKRYGWSVKDSCGKIQYINKNILQIHPSYQRNASQSKILDLASSWSWVACGAIIVGSRDGEFWVIDGQHRVLGAKRRSDIKELPCVVFETIGIEQEAAGFLNVNINRKAMSSLDKYMALLVIGDESAVYVKSTFDKYGIIPDNQGTAPRSIKSVVWALNCADSNRDAFDIVMELTSILCTDLPLKERVLGSLYYMQTHGIDLREKKLRTRIINIGAIKIEVAAQKAAAFFAKGGAKIWSEGILLEINKGMKESNKWMMSTM